MIPLHHVAPGDLITAEHWNLLVAFLERLDARVEALEESDQRVRILEIDPGVASPGDRIVITGRNFAAPPSQNEVRVGPTAVNRFLPDSTDERLAFTLPAVPDLPATVRVVVANRSGEDSTQLRVQPDAVRPTGRVVARLASNSHLARTTLNAGDEVELVWNLWSETNVPVVYDVALEFRPSGAADAEAWRAGAALTDPDGTPVETVRLRPSTAPSVIASLPERLDLGAVASRFRGGLPSPGGGSTSFGGASPLFTHSSTTPTLASRFAAGDAGSVVATPVDRPTIPRDVLGGLTGAIPDLFRNPVPAGPRTLHARVRVPDRADDTYVVLRVRAAAAPDEPALNIDEEVNLPVGRTFVLPAPDVEVRPPVVRTPDGVRPTGVIDVEPGGGGAITYPVDLGRGLFEVDVAIEPDDGGWTLDEVRRADGGEIAGGNGLVTGAGVTEPFSIRVTAPQDDPDDTERFLRVRARRADVGGELTESFHRVRLSTGGA